VSGDTLLTLLQDNNLSATGTSGKIALPVGGFTPSPSSGMSPIDVTCTDTSTGGNGVYLWELSFGKSNYSVVSMVQNPVIHIPSPGDWFIRQTVYNAGGGVQTVFDFTAT